MWHDLQIFAAPILNRGVQAILDNFWLLVPGNIVIFAFVEIVKAQLRSRRKSDKHGIPNIVIPAFVLAMGVSYSWALMRVQHLLHPLVYTKSCGEEAIWEGLFLGATNIVIFVLIRSGFFLWKLWRGRGGRSERRKE